MKRSLEPSFRREPEETGNQTDGNAGRKRLAGSTPRNRLDPPRSRSRPPSRVQKALKRFGRRVQTLRKEKGLSQRQLGDDCAITASKMKRIEAGQLDLDLSTIIRLADRLRVRVDQILRGIK